MLNGELKTLNGTLGGEQVEIEGIQFAKPKFKFANQGDEFQIDFTSAETYVPNVRVFDPIWAKLNAESSNLEESLKFKKISAKFRTQALQDFSWSNVEFLGDRASLYSQGGWDKNNDLRGKVQVREKGKIKKWNLSGTRAQPIFSKE